VSADDVLAQELLEVDGGEGKRIVGALGGALG
jgi:hypothetical protein